MFGYVHELTSSMVDRSSSGYRSRSGYMALSTVAQAGCAYMASNRAAGQGCISTCTLDRNQVPMLEPTEAHILCNLVHPLIEHAYNVCRFVVHNGVPLLVPEDWHSVLPCIPAMPLLKNITRERTRQPAGRSCPAAPRPPSRCRDECPPERLQHAPLVSPAFSYRSRMYLAPILGSGMQSSQGKEPWPVVLLNGGSLGSANVHLCRIA